MDWYLCQVRTGQTDLRALFELERRGIERYYPLVRDVVVAAQRHMTKRERQIAAAGVNVYRERTRPFLPRYLFVRVGGGMDWDDLFEGVKLRGLMCGHAGRAVRIDEAIITNMAARQVGGAIPGDRPAIEIFSVGDAVTLKRGHPWLVEGHSAAVQKVWTEKVSDIDVVTGLTVLVNILGHPVPMDIALDMVVKATTVSTTLLTTALTTPSTTR